MADDLEGDQDALMKACQQQPSFQTIEQEVGVKRNSLSRNKYRVKHDPTLSSRKGKSNATVFPTPCEMTRWEILSRIKISFFLRRRTSVR